LLPEKMATLKKMMIVQLLLGITRCGKCNSATLIGDVPKLDLIQAYTCVYSSKRTKIF